MMIPISMAGAFGLNAVLGALLALVVYAVLERRPLLSAPIGFGMGAVLIFAQARFGTELLQVSLAQMKLLVIMAAAGGVVGTTAVLISLEPETEASGY